MVACFRKKHPPPTGNLSHGELWGQCPPPSLPGLPHGAGRLEQTGHGPGPKLAGTTWHSVGWGGQWTGLCPLSWRVGCVGCL